MSADDWRDADQADVTQAVHYALRFSLSGKPHGKRRLGESKALAEHVVAHLLRANYWIQQGSPRKPHSTSDLGRNPGGMPQGWMEEPPP